MEFNGLLEKLLSYGLSRESIVIIVSALPVIELRGAIPLAINVFNFPWYKALVLAITGNLVPVPLLLLFLDAISHRLSKTGVLERWFNRLKKRTTQQGGIVERYRRIGLAIFVAVPVPLTGAWSGSLAATIFKIKFRDALLFIFIGLCIAGGIVTGICLLSHNMF